MNFKSIVEIDYMKDKAFIDTNIFVYAFLDIHKNEEDRLKSKKAKNFLREIGLNSSLYISTQVCNEFYSVLLKNKVCDEIIQKNLIKIIKVVNTSSINLDTIEGAFFIKNNYNFSYWDSLILSSALENCCSILFSEDMQDGQVIDNRLQIINPLK